jgi:predicted transcriptional regulator
MMVRGIGLRTVATLAIRFPQPYIARHKKRFEPMGAAKRVTVRLPGDVVRAADDVATKRECSRSALVEDALRWYLRVQGLAWDEASPEEMAAIESGRSEIARGEFVTIEEIKRELEADLLEQRTKESEKTSAK